MIYFTIIQNLHLILLVNLRRNEYTAQGLVRLSFYSSKGVKSISIYS